MIDRKKCENPYNTAVIGQILVGVFWWFFGLIFSKKALKILCYWLCWIDECFPFCAKTHNSNPFLFTYNKVEFEY